MHDPNPNEILVEPTDDYEYRDPSDYNGVVIEVVPMKTTAEPHHAKLHSKTNRFPKLRKYFGSSDYFV